MVDQRSIEAQLLSDTVPQDPVKEVPPESQSQPPLGEATHLTPTRISGSWTAVVGAVLLLILLVVFIAQNTQDSTIHFLGAHGRAPTAVMLLIAATAGAGIASIVAIFRIIQLRKSTKDQTR